MLLPLLTATLLAPIQDVAPGVAGAVATGRARVLGAPARAHGVVATSCDLSPDGARALSTGFDGCVRLWDTATGAAAGVLDGHGEAVFFADFLDDGRVVSAGDDGTLRVWDLAKGEVVKSHQVQAESPRFGAASHDGKLVAFALSTTGRVHIYDVARMEEVDSLPALGAMTLGVAFSPDDRYVAACGQGAGFLVVYDRDKAELVVQVSLEKNAYGLAFTPDGACVAVASGDRVLLWKLATGQVVDQVSGVDEPVHAVALSPDAQVLYFGTRLGQVHGVELESGDTVFVREGHHAVVTGLHVSRDGALLLSSAGDGSVRFWDIATQLETRAADQPNDVVQALAWSADGKQLYSASYDGRVDVWTVESGAVRNVQARPAIASSVCLVDRAPVCAMGAHLWGVGAAPLASFEDDDDAFVVVAAAGPGQVLAGLASGGVELRDARTGEVLRAYEGHDDRVHAIALAPDGARFATVAEDGALRVFALATEEPVFADEDASWDAVFGVAWLDDERLASVDVLGHLRVRAAATGADQRVVVVERGADEDEVTSAVYDVARLGDGRLVTTSDAGLRVWSAAEQGPAGAVDTPGAAASCLALSPDGRTLAAGMTNGTIVLWDVARIAD
jgi:WD40 repeat protein